MVTTIQISENLRDILQKYKKTSKSSYEEVIKDLIEEHEKSKKADYLILKEGYEEMYGLSKKVSDEFDKISIEDMEKNDY